MSAPNPALVSQGAARPLPRLALLLACAAYVLPGIAGRDPWRNADLVAFAQMNAIAGGRASWLVPSLGGVPVADSAILPHALGAAFIGALGPLVGSAVAARLPFSLLLALTLALVWYATFHLARTEKAQPLPFAFGGEAAPVDYARAIADGATLALIATLGLLQLGHETTPELVQLFGVSLALYALAAAPYRGWQPRAAMVASMPILAVSGAPSMALAIGVAGTVVCLRSAYAEVRGFARWVAGATAAAALLAWAIDAWRWRGTAMTPGQWAGVLRQWAWFLWPAWPFVVWTLWRWRRYTLRRHIAVPLTIVAVAVGANLSMGGSDRALMLGIPGAAVLAAFALPTFRRSTAAAIDWFSVFFFTGCAMTIWVIYVAMHTGVPAKPAANVSKVLPGFVPLFSALLLGVAVAATVAWVWLVRWRTGRHREAVWKSMALPAGGVLLCWLLLMTLWLPGLDYARSSRPLMERLAAVIPAGECIVAAHSDRVLLASLESTGRWRVDARGSSPAADCRYAVRVVRGSKAPAAAPDWEAVAEVRRPTERDEITAVYRRAPAR
jgi:hypothetical protein